MSPDRAPHCHPDPYFAGTLGHPERKKAMDTDTRQQHGQSGKRGEHDDLGPAGCGFRIDDVGKETYIRHRQFRVGLSYNTADVGDQRIGGLRRTDDQVLGGIENDRTVRHLFIGQIDLRLAARLEAPNVDVTHDTGNDPVSKGEVEAATQGILPGPVPASEGLADNGDGGDIIRVEFTEVPAGRQGDGQRLEEVRCGVSKDCSVGLVIHIKAIDSHRPDSFHA